MTKKEVIAAISEETGMAQKNVSVVVESLISTIKEAQEKDGRVDFRGFGSFVKKVRKARTARNIKTGETVDVPEKTVLVFRQSRNFND